METGVKTISSDSRSKNRLRFASTKQRAKRASADVYRSYKRRGIGVTSAATREERVHFQGQKQGKSTTKNRGSSSKDRVALIKKGKKNQKESSMQTPQQVENASDAEEDADGSSTFAEELELAYERNASEIFTKLYHAAWPLVRSLPELLHHSTDVVELLLSYMVSSTEAKDTPQMISLKELPIANKESSPVYVMNHATTEVLHLLAVLARDLRHEIHPFVHKWIVPRILNDLLFNGSPNSSEDPAQQAIASTNNVTLTETVFRTLSYIFKYDTQMLVSSDGGSLECMRQYYGATLGNSREYVRRLSAETFAPLVRKLKSDKLRAKHFRRILRALTAAVSSSLAGPTKRSLENAVDGIALLFHTTARGISGRLHSKGANVLGILLDCLIAESTKEPTDMPTENVVYNVTSTVFVKICGHVHATHFLPIWEELCLRSNKVSANIAKHSDSTNCTGIMWLIQILEECVSFRNRVLLRVCSETDRNSVLEQISHMLQQLLAPPVYRRLTPDTQKCALQLLCSAWRIDPSHRTFGSRISHFLPSLVAMDHKGDDKNGITVNPALLLSKDLLPYLPPKQGLAMKVLAPAILTSASKLVREYGGNRNDEALVLVQSVATLRQHYKAEDDKQNQPMDDDCDDMEEEEEDNHDTIEHGDEVEEVEGDDRLFSFKHARSCIISPLDRTTLLDICLTDLSDVTYLSKNEGLARLGYVARCLPFLTFIGQEQKQDVDDETHLEIDDPKNDRNVGRAEAVTRVCKWLTSTLKALDKEFTTKPNWSSPEELVVANGLILEAAAHIHMSCLEDPVLFQLTEKTMGRLLSNIRTSANNFLFLNPRSIWTIRSVAATVKALGRQSTLLNDRADDVFELLLENLSSSNHFLRLHSLTILCSYPQKTFVIDHASLDLTGDLDEEPSFQPTLEDEDNDMKSIDKDTSRKELSTSALQGQCSIMDALLELESTPVNFANERCLTSIIGKVEIYGRSGQLPISYAEAAANHMFGIMYVKYSPLWPAAIRALTAIASVQENCMWPALHRRLNAVMEIKLPDVAISKESTSCDQDSTSSHDIGHHAECCAAWSKSNGKDIRIFLERKDVAYEQGRVSWHQCTDESTIFGLVWSVIEGIPELTAKNSRVIVPMFLEFLHYQYYVYHTNDPDAREFCLVAHMAPASSSIRHLVTKEQLGRKSLQQKLSSFLKTFAAVNGPQQLFKHKVLLSIFIAYLSNPDHSIAQLSLKCVIKYKLPYITPYSETLGKLLAKGEFRETLTKFDISVEADTINSQHRKKLIPVLIRVLFGRLVARGSGTKSSKDSPAARRAAILSFMSSLRESEGELDSFVYLMVRVYIPPHVNVHDCDNTKELLDSSAKISVQEVGNIQMQRHEGFLNLLADVVSRLGYGIKSYVPAFLSIVLTICDHVALEPTPTDTALLHSNDNEAEEQSDDVKETVTVSRSGKVRGLCYSGISDILSHFTSSMDFLPYSTHMWKILSPAIEKLSFTVMNAVRAPSLLILLESISANTKLIPLLKDHEEAVKAVYRCISPTSRNHVMDVSLRFVDNLLTEGGSQNEEVTESLINSSVGIQLVQKHTRLLIAQFTSRLEHESRDNIEENDHSRISQNNFSKQPQMNQTSTRELAILCRVSELLMHPSSGETGNNEMTGVLESLYSLLVPFLKQDRRINEDNQINVLGILSSIVTRIRGEAALSKLQALSNLLGPQKSKAGITSPEIRQMIIKVIGAIACCEGVNPALVEISAALVNLSAMHTKRIDEIDFDRVLPVINALGGSSKEAGSWFDLSGPNKETSSENDGPYSGVKVLLPLICTCFHLLYNEDGVVSRGALKALKILVSTASVQANTVIAPNSDANCNEWALLIEQSFVPFVRAGLGTGNDSIRKHYILLLAEVSKQFNRFESPHLYGDLNKLIRDDEPDVDFFLNITHVQIHRRGRALARLRKILASGPDSVEEDVVFSSQTLCNVLLPLALHPIYECTSNTSETFALEAIATTGAIAKHLPWSKYQSTLWMILMQLPRFPDQERYLVGALCAIIDAFHFDVITGSGETPDDTDANSRSSAEVALATNGNGVWRALKNRIIPKVESYLIRDKVEKNGSTTKVLRSPIALALMKLLQKLPSHIFQSKLPRLLRIVCDALRNKDSQARDIARNTLANMSASLDSKYLADVVRELASTLSEGYQLHVRSAALHSVILAFSKVYVRAPAPSREEASSISFDKCVPALMDLIQQDIFGTASEMKESDGIRKRVIKEAMGNKSYDTLEIMCRLCLFMPSLAVTTPKEKNGKKMGSTSSAHSILSPLLERLRDPDIDNATIGKVKQCMTRVVAGMAQNSSCSVEELLPFVYASTAPFIKGIAPSLTEDADGGDSDGEDEGDVAMNVTRSNQSSQKESTTEVTGQQVSKVAEWLPSSLKGANSDKEAILARRAERRELHKVRDGASAPKLTGSFRHSTVKDTGAILRVNDSAAACAVVTGLSLLHSFLKKTQLDLQDGMIVGMADPFIPLLTNCTRSCSDNDVILLALKCLGVLLRLDLPSSTKFSKKLGENTLLLLTTSGSGSNMSDGIVQGCFKTLILLINLDKTTSTLEEEDHIKKGDDNETMCKGLPLNTEQMEALISLLQLAVTESIHHNPTFGLIKAIASRRYASASFYDLMDTILKLSVQSQKSTVRQQSRHIFMKFLVDYPMGKQRLEKHIKQVVLNIKYDYEEGRLSALELLSTVIQKFPLEVLEEHTQLFFLPLVLQLVNDDSKQCREVVSGCLSDLLGRLSVDTLQILYDYASRWFKPSGEANRELQRAAAQLFGLFVKTRPNFVKRNNLAVALTSDIVLSIDGELSNMTDDWEFLYFCLLCLEKLQEGFPDALIHNDVLWKLLVKSFIHPHSWIKQVSSRMINKHVSGLDPAKFASGDAMRNSFLARQPGSIYEVARNLCFQLNASDDDQVEILTTLAIKTLTWVIQAMHHNPELCFGNEGNSHHDESDGENGHGESNQNPVTWLMTRLAGAAKKRGDKRRAGVFKCFAAFCTLCDKSIIVPYMEVMIEPLHRAIIDASFLANRENNQNNSFRNKMLNQPEDDDSKSNLPKDVLEVMEETFGTENFLTAYANVKVSMSQKKEKRKMELAAEAVHDPKAFAKRKQEKQEKEKVRRKRVVEKKKSMRGAFSKRPRFH